MTEYYDNALRNTCYDIVIGKPLSGLEAFSDFVIIDLFVRRDCNEHHVLLNAENPNELTVYEGFLLTYLKENNIPIDREKFDITGHDEL